MRRVYNKQFSAWSPLIQAQLRRYNFGTTRGHMAKALTRDPDTFVMLDEGSVLGWALMTHNGWAMFYVRAEYRREGIGKRLAMRLNKQYTRPQVEGWDRRSSSFFRAVGLTRDVRYAG